MPGEEARVGVLVEDLANRSVEKAQTVEHLPNYRIDELPNSSRVQRQMRTGEETAQSSLRDSATNCRGTQHFVLG